MIRGGDGACGVPARPDATLQIGEVAERIGLSQTTLRHYDQAGLVVPSARSQGGFRLYTEDDVARLLLVRRMKPLGFSLDEMRELLATVEALSDGPGGPDASPAPAAPDGQPQGPPDGSPPDAQVLERLAGFHAAATTRCALLRAELAMAQEYADMLGSLLGEAASAPTR